jgi:arylsulfatase A-like enzyme
LRCWGIAVGVALILSGAVEAAPARPNVVYIIADDLGYGDVRVLNPQRGRIDTPHMDRLARAGMVFTDVHGGSSVCTPTRYGVLTGRYAWRTHLQSGVIDGEAPPLIAQGRLTVAGLLRSQGYHTAAIGKWHLGFEYERSSPGRRNEAEIGTRITGGPTTRGFDYYYGFNHARSMKNLVENDRVIEHLEPVRMLGRLTDRAAEYVTERAKGGGPFFLYFALNSPHTPIVPGPDWAGRSGLGDYGDFVMQTDDAVGRVVEAIDRAGIAERTLVILTSDNGCSKAAGIDRLEQQGHYPSGVMRGSKADLWDGGHRIPFLVRWPGVVRAGSTSDSLICLTDLMATLAELSGAALPPGAGEDSISFLGELTGAGRSKRASIVHHSISGHFAVRDGSMKLLLAHGSGGWSSPDEKQAARQGLPSAQLYDLAADLNETTNLLTARPDEAARLRTLLEKIVTEGRSTPGAPQSNDAMIQINKPDSERSGKK